MDTFDKWFSRLMWATDIILLLASMPHIAAWFAHFDNPTDMLSSIYAWGVGFGLALAIDGVSLMLLLAITRMIRQGKAKSRGTMFGLLAFMSFIALLSWGINWQYNIQFASGAFAKADAVQIYGPFTVGGINPIIGGAFPILMLAYALVAKAMQVEVKPITALSDEEQAQRLKRARQEQEFKEATKGKGFIAKIGDGLKETKQVFSELLPVENIDLNTLVSGPTTDPLNAINLLEDEAEESELKDPLKTETSEEYNEETEAGKTEENSLVKSYPRLAPLLSTGQRTASIKQVIEATGHSSQMIANRIKDGTLKTAPRNDKLIVLNTLYKWLETAPKPKAKTTEKQSA